MKKNISILLIVLCILVISTLILFAEDIKYGFQNEPDGFRGLKWGDAPTEDMTFIGKLDVVGSDFYTKIGDKKDIGTAKFFALGYAFYNDRFMQAMGFFRDKDNYNTLETICREKYGEPTEEGYYKLTWYGSETIILLIYDKDGGSLIFGSIKITKEKDEVLLQKEIEKTEEDF